MSDRDYLHFIDAIKKKTGIDLSLYKEAQMKRRLTSLREKKGYKDFETYFAAMQKSHDLFDEFLERMTINVSEFYRNPQRWDVLETKILPSLIREKKQLKVWSAACSTGEEPYTLSIILSNQLPVSNFSILATDLDKVILERAKVGFYTDRSIKDVPPPILKSCFHKDGMGYAIKDEYKRLINFKQQNLLADRFDSGFDLIVCRNVMIYFTEEAKNELYHKFCQALRPGGILFVGSTEQLFNPGKYGFEPVDTFFYQRKE